MAAVLFKSKPPVDKGATVRRIQIVFGVAVLTLGILSGLTAVRAGEPFDGGVNGNASGEPFQTGRISLRFQTSENLSLGAVTESSAEPSASELNRELTNPVSSIWSISNQFNNFELNNGQWNNNWNFQPVLPVSLTKDWNLITRPVMPFYRRRLGRSGSGGTAVACALGQLAPRSGADGYLSDCDLGVHRPGQVAAWAYSPHWVPDERVHLGRLPSAVVVHRRRARTA